VLNTAVALLSKVTENKTLRIATVVLSTIVEVKKLFPDFSTKIFLFNILSISL